eukprot:1217127-Pleurochrysis_carterae.AAC.1
MSKCLGRCCLEEYNVIECRELHCLWYFPTWLDPFMHTVGAFATGQHGDGMHKFVLRKDALGVVRIYFRKSSQASTWLPEGPGMEVFKSPPHGKPPFASFKSDSGWERHTVDWTVRRWLPHLVLSEQDRVAAIDEWERRL